MNTVKDKTYYVRELNSTKANVFVSYYHHSGTGYKRANLNLGAYRHKDKKLVGVLQWGCSPQNQINLNSYVEEFVQTKEYLKLNRFCTANENEDDIISLGVEWIKKFMPDIRLLIGCAGKRESDYGILYQNAKWEYLGCGTSNNDWTINGQPMHTLTLWGKYVKENTKKNFNDWIIDSFKDIRRKWSKEFTYILRLDETLTPKATFPYPSFSTDYPIVTKAEVLKLDENAFQSYKRVRRLIEYYDVGEEQLFTTRTLIRRGEFVTPKIAVYDVGGNLIATADKISKLVGEYGTRHGIRIALNNYKIYKRRYYREFLELPQEKIDVPIICEIDGISFAVAQDIVRYLNTSKQTVSLARKKKKETILNTPIKWVNG